MDKIPTAESFFFDRGAYMSDVPEAMIEFAKLHVKANSEAILKQIRNCSSQELTEAYVESILNAYPDKLII